MYTIGVDLGGTNIAAGLVDENYKIVLKHSIPTVAGATAREIVRDIGGLCWQLINAQALSLADIGWIGVGVPGAVDDKAGIVHFCNNINMNEDPVSAWLAQEGLTVPIRLGNDANCAALGEAYAGAAGDVDSSVMVTLGTGVGGGIIIDKKIYQGFNGAAGEIGHTVIAMDGERCSCGRNGCWEAYASATALARQTYLAALEQPDSTLGKMVDGKPENCNGKTAFDAMRLGCPVGKAVVDRYITYLAAGIVDMINIFQPNAVVIGGGISKEGQTLLDLLDPIVEGERYQADIPQTQLRIAALGNDAGIIGAAMLGF